MRHVWRIGGLAVVLSSVVACGGSSGPAASAQSPPPTASAATPTPRCTPDLGRSGSAKVEPAFIAVELALADGLDLQVALEAVFGTPLAAMRPDERADALHVLAGLDSCPAQNARVRDRVPQLVHLLADQSAPSELDADAP